MRSEGDIDFVIDMESSTNAAIDNGCNVGDRKSLLYKEWSGLLLSDWSIRDEEAVSFDNRLHNCALARLDNGVALVADKRVVRDEKVEKVLRAGKPKKKGFKKPPRPPRPPSLDLADQKLIREISELTMLKKAKADRMKALKKTRNGKSASSFTGNMFALVVTLIFCIVIFWQGIFPKGCSNSAFPGSPLSSIGTTTSINSSVISILFYPNASTNPGSS